MKIYSDIKILASCKWDGEVAQREVNPECFIGAAIGGTCGDGMAAVIGMANTDLEYRQLLTVLASRLAREIGEPVVIFGDPDIETTEW